MIRRLLSGLILLLLAISIAQLVLAEPNPATGLTVGASSSRNLSALNTTSALAQGGNITRLDINAISITQSWQGYYGNVSGDIVLQNAQNQSFYEWNNGTSTSGEIYASRNSTIDWSTINCSNTTEVSAEESYLGQSASDTDSVSNTFNETDHAAFLVGLVNLTGCPSTNIYINGTSQNTDFDQILLADGNGTIVYSTIIEGDQYGFDGNRWDFQLLVGENEHSGSEGTTTYYFYTELS